MVYIHIINYSQSSHETCTKMHSPYPGSIKTFYARFFTQAAFLTNEDSFCTASGLLPVLSDVPAGLRHRSHETEMAESLRKSVILHRRAYVITDLLHSVIHPGLAYRRIKHRTQLRQCSFRMAQPQAGNLPE